jgi:hypothetical protein
MGRYLHLFSCNIMTPLIKGLTMTLEITTIPHVFQTLSSEDWHTSFPEEKREKCILSLEQGQLIYFPHLAFHLFPNEMPLLDAHISNQKRKNISYHPQTNRIHGIKKIKKQKQQSLQVMLARFSEHARLLIENLFPRYQQGLIWGRTSYRPAQVSHRISSSRKDDRRLHVDAFPASPNQGKRILRVFTNINPHGEDRVWRIGEPFEKVVNRFLPKLHRPLPGSASLLKWLHVTKSLRTPYDHYMLQLHDNMKADENYQQNVHYTELRFPPGSTWIVQTDHVSHAAMSGQFMLEQTFYLPVESMKSPEHSPLKVLERKLKRELI